MNDCSQSCERLSEHQANHRLLAIDIQNCQPDLWFFFVSCNALDPKQYTIARTRWECGGGKTQTVLFDAVHMTIRARRDFKQILRFAKLAKLMHRITMHPDHYRFDFDGPASILQSTHRYGIAMAKFLPGLLSCSGWSTEAVLHRSQFRSPVQFRLEDPCGLTSNVKQFNEFDSSVEELFAKQWGDELRDGWRLERETEILHRGQTVFFPDFVFVHSSGRRILFEIIGFWTPENLKYKSHVLDQFQDEAIMLAIARSLKGKWEASIEHPVIVFRNQIQVDEVVDRLKDFLRI